MTNQLEKALNIAKKSGDKIIVIDTASTDEGMVIMPLDQYEKIIDQEQINNRLTEEQMIDKINRDIANVDFGENEELDEFDNSLENNEDELEESEDNLYYYNNDEEETRQTLRQAPFGSEPQGRRQGGQGDEKMEAKEDDFKTRNNWRIPNQIKNQAEEVVEDLPF